jgi:murein DD-endopeptidase MepM/ murein hydrolase activator NlpD
MASVTPFRLWILASSIVLALVAMLWTRAGREPKPTADATGAAVMRTPAIVAPVISSRLLIPVSGVDPADLVDSYTQARGEGRVHDAIDIVAPRGTPVIAVADGSVLELFLSERGGTTLYQLARDGHTIYYYAHLDRYAEGMADGIALRQGDVIGYVGDSGNAGPGNTHLHFEITTTTDAKIYWGGTPQNPYPLLR